MLGAERAKRNTKVNPEVVTTWNSNHPGPSKQRQGCWTGGAQRVSVQNSEETPCLIDPDALEKVSQTRE